ncbi:hypothetical protein H9N25_05620 [Pedobacter riviphilus]|uniref:Uncharacterized protein n=1 Tax=Pedobacter riviphilus TaxID=2766984 RepID=A0ABX6TK75_9SPHI|nr:hypothetical protein [Pedobacter riviphilus]QNR85923.1 hypothetical protein H9N25_05620 [Pedobacter riviphilus]
MNRINSYFLVLLLGCLCSKTYAQAKPAFDGPSWKPPYQLELDNWGIERFPIPIDFAPSIKYTGVEDTDLSHLALEVNYDDLPQKFKGQRITDLLTVDRPKNVDTTKCIILLI